MNIQFDLEVALKSELPFSLAWRRVRCIAHGHVVKDSKLIDKLRSEKHPNTNPDFIYTVNIYSCSNCGLIFNSFGLEYRAEPSDLK